MKTETTTEDSWGRRTVMEMYLADHRVDGQEKPSSSSFTSANQKNLRSPLENLTYPRKDMDMLWKG